METGVEKIVELNGGEPAPRKTGVNRVLELLGGEPAKNKTGVDRIVEILEQGGGGGSSLPSYSSADKGKVLTIGEGEGGETVEPKWEAIGGGALSVSVTFDSSLNALVCDKTASEMYSADAVVLIFDNPAMKCVVVYSKMSEQEGYYFAITSPDGQMVFSANAASDYPLFTV